MNRFFIILIFALWAVAVLFGCVAISMECEEETIIWKREVEEYVVQTNDTLSGIAARYCPEDMEFEEYLEELCRVNERKKNIYLGETIKVLIYEKIAEED